MSLRLTKPGMTPADEFIAAHRRIIGYGKRGPVWAAAGGAPEDGDTDPADGGDDDTGDEGDDADEEDDDTEGDDDAKTGKGKKDDEEPTVPQWKYDKLHNRMTAADKRSSELQKQIDELKSGKDVNAEVKKELDEVKANVKNIESERDRAVERANGLTIRLAAVTLTGVPEWEDIETVLKLADLSDVDVSDDGKVDKRALKSALNQLAKEKPYLVKKKAAEGDRADGDGRTGSTMNGKRKGEKDTSTREALASRFPALSQATIRK